MRDENRGWFEVDRDTKEYLDGFKRDIQKSLESLEQHIKDLLESNIKPIESTLERHTADIGDLYEKHRETLVDYGKIDGRVKTLEDDKQDSKFSTEMKLAFGGVVVALFGVAAAILIAIFGS